ncbi:MAG: hypothetical protein SGILL_003228 [Bacillariaceae sp.]
MAPLSSWAQNWGVTLADGLQLTEDSAGDWTLTMTEPAEQGTPLLTVPSHLILTSDIQDDAFLPYYDEKDMRNVQTFMLTTLLETTQAESATVSAHSFQQQNYVLPEFMLTFKLLQEVYLGNNSRWNAWWQSLPQTFSTGLYLDDVERRFVQSMAGDFLHTHELQYRAFLGLITRMMEAQQQQQQLVTTTTQTTTTTSVIPNGFYLWLLETQDMEDEDGENLFESLVKWAFTVVCTRSWRSPDRRHAHIIPLGDLANHDSQKANLQPLFRPIDGAFQFYLTKDINQNLLSEQQQQTPSKLYLSYGSCSMPARYLVLFGFCDESAPFVDAHIDFLNDKEDNSHVGTGTCNENGNQLNNVWPKSFLDQSKMVISTSNGAMSEEVWIAFLYKLLREKDPDALTTVREAYKGEYDITTVEGDQMVEELWKKWEVTIGAEMQEYYRRLLETAFAPIMVTETKDLFDHPNLAMLVKYNLFMRDCFIRALKHLNLLLDPATSEEDSASKHQLGSGQDQR